MGEEQPMAENPQRTSTDTMVVMIVLISGLVALLAWIVGFPWNW
jgi:hypothetical protein